MGFNRKEHFKSGDIVLFNGFGLIIAKITGSDMVGFGYNIGNSMHFDHSVIREATMNEIKMLEIKSFNFKIKNKV
jgi:hypothetical protein